MGLKTFLFWNTYWGRHDERFTHAKTFHRVFTAVDRDCITSRLIYYKIFCTMLFSIDVHWNSSVKLTKVLVRCLNASYLKNVIRCVRTTCIYTVCDILKAHPQSRWYFMLIGWLWRMYPIRVEQTAWLLLLAAWQTSWGCWSLRKLHFSKNYLVVSTWIFNGSSNEYHKKKHQPFCLFGVRFGSRAIQIAGWKSAWRWSSVVTVNAKPTSSLKFSILDRKSFVTSKQFKWKA